MGGIYQVRPMQSVLYDLNAQPGQSSDRSLLVGKAVLIGSHAYNIGEHPFNHGSVPARRLEGILISCALEGALAASKSAGLELSAATYVDNGRLGRALQHEGQASVVLSSLRRRLSHQKNDYRLDRLTGYGERILGRIMPTLFARQLPIQVNLAQLESYSMPSVLKQLHKEMRLLEDLALQL